MTNTKEKTKKGRKIIAALLVVVLGSALFVNWLIHSANLPLSISASTTAQSDEELGKAQYVSATTAKNDYFKESKLKREKTMDNSLKELGEVIDSDKSTSDEKKSAIEMYSKLSERKALESALNEYQNRTGTTKDLELFCKKYMNLLIIVDHEISVLQMYFNDLTFIANAYKDAQVKSLQQAYLLK